MKLERNITTWLAHTHRLCAILSNQDLYPWFFQKYIHISSCDHFPDYLRLDYTRHPYQEILSENQISYQDVIQSNIDIISFCLEQIQNNNYLIIFVDENLLPQHLNYKQRNFVHETMIYGYDIDAQKLMALSFNKDHIFDKITYDFKDFYAAFEQGKDFYKETTPWAEDKAIRFFRIKDNMRCVRFEIDNFLTEFKKYVYSIDELPSDSHAQQYCKNFTFGINIYNSVSDSIAGINDRYPIDYRGLHFLYEHKIGMLKRFKYIQELYSNSQKLDDLIAKYSDFVKYVNAIRSKYMQQLLVENGGVLRTVRCVGDITQISKMINKAKELDITLSDEILNVLLKRQDQRSSWWLE